MQENIDPCPRFLRLGNVLRAGIPDCSVSPIRSIHGEILKEMVSASIYALTRRNRTVTGFFVILTTAQVILGAIFLASPDNTGEALDPASEKVNNRPRLPFFL